MNFLIKLRTTTIRCREDDGIIWIDPARVERFCGSKWPHCHITDNFWIRRLFEINPAFSFLILGGEWDIKSNPITEIDKYLLMKDFVDNIPYYDRSLWYQGLVNLYRIEGMARHKSLRMRSMDDINSFFVQYAIPLVNSLSVGGYKYENGDEVGSVAIDRNGAMHKAGSGTHRFFLSKILGVHSVPVQVTFVHPDWLQREGLTLRRSGRRRILETIRRNLSGPTIGTIPSDMQAGKIISPDPPHQQTDWAECAATSFQRAPGSLQM
jgi:hypothetical protein